MVAGCTGVGGREGEAPAEPEPENVRFFAGFGWAGASPSPYPAVAAQQRRTSATLQAWAQQPRGV
jgi:hypothetical protein